jgi:hypothetical protein
VEPLRRVTPFSRLDKHLQRPSPPSPRTADQDNGKAIRGVCREFVALCRKLDLLDAASVAIDGSKFKAVNARDKNFTEANPFRAIFTPETG